MLCRLHLLINKEVFLPLTNQITQVNKRALTQTALPTNLILVDNLQTILESLILTLTYQHKSATKRHLIVLRNFLLVPSKDKRNSTKPSKTTRISWKATLWRKKLKCARTGWTLESANMVANAALPMVSMNLEKSNT